MHAVEIIGGGLAGLSLGLALRRAGVPVTLHEAGTYPRHRVCGEFISGLDAGTVAQLGLEPCLAGALALREVTWFIGPTAVRTHRLPAAAYAISRFELDARLADTFTAAGGDLRVRSRVTDATPAPGRVVATGRRRGRSRSVGLKVHARELAVRGDLEVHLGNGCYVGVSKLPGGEVNICGLFEQRSVVGHGAELLCAYAEACGLGALAERLRQAAPEDASFCAVAAMEFDRRLPGGSGMSVGDALAAIPPFTGNGMAMALQGATLSAPPLAAYARGEVAWSDACQAARTAMQRRFRLRLLSADLLHPFLLRRRRQHWLALLGRSRLLPLTPLYAAVH